MTIAWDAHLKQPTTLRSPASGTGLNGTGLWHRLAHHRDPDRDGIRAIVVFGTLIPPEEG